MRVEAGPESPARSIGGRREQEWAIIVIGEGATQRTARRPQAGDNWDWRQVQGPTPN